MKLKEDHERSKSTDTNKSYSQNMLCNFFDVIDKSTTKDKTTQDSFSNKINSLSASSSNRGRRCVSVVNSVFGSRRKIV